MTNNPYGNNHGGGPFGGQPGRPEQGNPGNQGQGAQGNPFGGQPGNPGQPGQSGPNGGNPAQGGPAQGGQPSYGGAFGGQPGQGAQANPFGGQQGGYNQGSPFGGQPGQQGNPFGGQPGGNPFGQPNGNQYGAQPTGGNGGNKVPLIIGALVLVIALLAGAYFLFVGNKEDKDSSASSSSSSQTAASSSASATSSTASATSTTRSSSSSSSSSGIATSGYGSPDQSLPAVFKTDLPMDVSDKVYNCEDTEFTLQYEDSNDERKMKGATCTGAKGAAWEYSSIDFIDDDEYAKNVIDRARNGQSKGNTIVKDEAGNFAAMETANYKKTLVVVNPDKGTVLEIEHVLGGEKEMKDILKQLGYSV